MIRYQPNTSVIIQTGFADNPTLLSIYDVSTIRKRIRLSTSISQIQTHTMTVPPRGCAKGKVEECSGVSALQSSPWALHNSREANTDSP